MQGFGREFYCIFQQVTAATVPASRCPLTPPFHPLYPSTTATPCPDVLSHSQAADLVTAVCDAALRAVRHEQRVRSVPHSVRYAHRAVQWPNGFGGDASTPCARAYSGSWGITPLARRRNQTTVVQYASWVGG